MNQRSEQAVERLLRMLSPILEGRKKSTYVVESHLGAMTTTFTLVDAFSGERATITWAKDEGGLNIDSARFSGEG